jgi:glycosyltransferase involved in cell wall biosynthesis
MEKQPLISIIVPVYKVEKFLSKCVDSILNQTYRNIEIILIDDGSPDNSPAICDEYAEKDNRIKVIHQRNAGQAGARNAGLAICRGEYIAFVDSDDYIEPNMMEAMLNAAVNNDCDIVRCNCATIKDGVRTEQEAVFRSGCMSKKDYMDLIMTDCMGSQPCFALYKSTLWGKIRFPEGRVFEDLAVIYKIYHLCTSPCYIINEPFYNYLLHSESTSFRISPTKNYDIFQAFKERYEFAEKYYPNLVLACLRKAASTALGAINYWLRYPQARITSDQLQNVEKFLADNMANICKLKFSCATNLMLRFYYINPRIYKNVVGLIYKCRLVH